MCSTSGRVLSVSGRHIIGNPRSPGLYAVPEGFSNLNRLHTASGSSCMRTLRNLGKRLGATSGLTDSPFTLSRRWPVRRLTPEAHRTSGWFVRDLLPQIEMVQLRERTHT